MDAPTAATRRRQDERDRLARAHYEICTALTVLRSNVELVRIELRHQPLDSDPVPLRAHLSELDGAVDRLRGLAHEMKQWHDGVAPPSTGLAPRAAGE